MGDQNTIRIILETGQDLKSYRHKLVRTRIHR